MLFIEGKRTESVSPSTLWFKQRSQLWRNVEAAREFAGGKYFGVIVAVETEADGNRALQDAAQSLILGLPHLTPEQQMSLNSHLLGFVTWSNLVRRFGLPATCLPDETVVIETAVDPEP